MPNERLLEWLRRIERGTSGDMVHDILSDWEKDIAETAVAKDAEYAFRIERLDVEIAGLRTLLRGKDAEWRERLATAMRDFDEVFTVPSKPLSWDLGWDACLAAVKVKLRQLEQPTDSLIQPSPRRVVPTSASSDTEMVNCPCVCHRYAREFRIGPACDCVLRGGCVTGKVKKNVPTASHKKPSAS